MDAFNVSTDQVEIGAVQFSESAADIISLSDDSAAIKYAISATSQMKLNTNTYAGFKQAKDMIDTAGRPTSKGKLAILLTDGVQNEGLPAKGMADQMKAEQIEIFGIGVGSQVSAKEIQQWVSTPVSDHYFTASDFSSLDKILQAVVAHACPHPPSPPRAMRPLK